MEAIISEKYDIRKAKIEVVRLLERILTIPSDITIIFNESYNHQWEFQPSFSFNWSNDF